MSLYKYLKQGLKVFLILGLIVASVLIIGGFSYIISFPVVKLINLKRGTDVPRWTVPINFAVQTAQLRLIILHNEGSSQRSL